MKKNPLIVVALRMNPADVGEIEKIAERKNLRRGAILRLAVEEFLKKHSQNENPSVRAA